MRGDRERNTKTASHHHTTNQEQPPTNINPPLPPRKDKTNSSRGSEGRELFVDEPLVDIGELPALLLLIWVAHRHGQLAFLDLRLHAPPRRTFGLERLCNLCIGIRKGQKGSEGKAVWKVVGALRVKEWKGKQRMVARWS